MNFTNINDPAGVSALLEQLRSSQAWIDLQSSADKQKNEDTKTTRLQHNSEPDISSSSQIAAHVPFQPSTSVASLLSRLRSQPSSSLTQQDEAIHNSLHSASAAESSNASSFSIDMPSPPRPKKEDLRFATFHQSLPHITRLSENSSFIEALAEMRREQNDLEKQLWEDRQAVISSQEEKVKVAVTKANMLGVGITKGEATAMTQSFSNELDNFHRQRVLPAWDGLISKQQEYLEQLEVPSMFVTDASTDRERQKRVIQVLEGIADPSGQ